ncbi:hypothetical protein ACPEEZ_12655 [Frigoribacterium sp. 2-23]|uniref:hypothetical protein n=1 Tax=Frigoribacterium sp. 2-23 TaxID=3415006 RepID=UPI003C6F4114
MFGDPVFLTDDDERLAHGRWRSRFLALVIVLGVLCAAFVGLTHFQGPKLTETQVDTSAVVERSGQQLRLFSNQAIAHVDASQIQVRPAAAFTVQTSGDVVAVQFSERLRYGTDYEVTVDGVSSAYQAQGATWSTGFSTAPATLYRLVRGANGADDRIESASLKGSDRTTLYAAPRIQAFEMFDSAIAVVTDDGTQSTLSLVATGSAGADGTGAAVETLPLPGAGLVTKLGADRATTTLAFSFEPTGSADATLYRLPLQGERKVTPIVSVSGQPITASDWFMVPGADELIVQALDETVSLIDLSGTQPATPLGTYSQLQGVGLDGTTFAAATSLNAAIIDIATGHETPRGPAPVGGVLPYGGPLVPLTGKSVVQQVALPAADYLSFRSLIVFDDGSTSRTLYEPPATGGLVEGFSVSPNGQYVAVETAGQTASSDFSYTIDPVPTDVTTVIVDVASGSVVASYAGIATSW